MVLETLFAAAGNVYSDCGDSAAIFSSSHHGSGTGVTLNHRFRSGSVEIDILGHPKLAHCVKEKITSHTAQWSYRQNNREGEGISERVC